MGTKAGKKIKYPPDWAGIIPLLEKAFLPVLS
jgi:hypothetical protein